MTARRGQVGDERGQGLAEFALALIPFLFILMGIVDFGRGIYMNNGVAEAAREIARVASVHQCTGPCTIATYSPETVAVIATQKSLVPGLTDGGITIACTTVSDTLVTVSAGGICLPGNYIRVTASGTFQLVSPIVPVPNPMTFSYVAHVQVP